MARKPTSLHAPFLKSVRTDMDALATRDGFPFDLPLVRKGSIDLVFARPVTIIVGENGSGKSTLLEAMADAAGFGTAGGTASHNGADNDTEDARRRIYEDFDEDTRDAVLPRAGKTIA